jgi:hypothetical protein
MKGGFSSNICAGIAGSSQEALAAENVFVEKHYSVGYTIGVFQR